MDRQARIKALSNRMMLDGKESRQQIDDRLQSMSDGQLDRLWSEQVSPRARLRKLHKN